MYNYICLNSIFILFKNMLNSRKNNKTIFDWYHSQYIESVDLFNSNFSTNFLSFIEDFPVKYEQGGESLQYPITGRIRMGSFLFLKFKYPLAIDGYTCCVINAEIHKANSHFAYLYWRKGTEDLDPEYVCLGPTYESRDGEYRKRFIKWEIFNIAFNYHTKDLHEFEEAVSTMLADSTLELNMTFYPAEPKIIRHYQHSRLPIKLFAYLLALDLWEFSTSLLMAHTHPEYIKLISNIGHDFPQLIKKSKEFQYKTIENFNKIKDINYITLKFEKHSENIEVQCGQKIVPMFQQEIIQFEDYNLSVWRETLIQQHISNLVINFICPSFPIYNQWTYIEDVNFELFENNAMADKYARGTAMERSVSDLRNARKSIDSTIDLQNYHTEEFNANIYEDIEYAQSHLIMSNIALLHTMEDVGWTLHSINDFINKPLVKLPQVAKIFREDTYNYIFNYVYAAHCMHTKMGIVHSDIHSNNLTFNLWALANENIYKNGKVSFHQYYKNPVTVYATSYKDEDIYIFPTTGITATIIDFSRSIIGPDFRPKLEKNKTPQIATNFYRDQVNRVMRALNRHAPSFVEKNQEAIKAAVIGNFELIFPVLCCIDFIAIGSTLIEYFERTNRETVSGGAKKSSKTKKLDKSSKTKKSDKSSKTASIQSDALRSGQHVNVQFCTKIKELGQELLITGLSTIVDQIKNINETKINIEYPGFKMLKLFEEYNLINFKQKYTNNFNHTSDVYAVTDGYNYNNDVKYSGTEYAKFPPWGQLSEIEKQLGKYKMEDVLESNIEKFLQSIKKNVHISIISEQARMESEKKYGEAIYTASSWLDE